MSEIWTLSVMSFKGTVPGAVHAYGVLSGAHDRNYKVRELLDKKAVAELNAHAERVGKDWLLHEVGEPGEFFMREGDLEECARVAFCFLAPPGAVLMRGMDPSLNPSQVIEGSQEVKDRLTPIYERHEGGTDSWDEWEAAIEELGLKPVGKTYHPDANLNVTVDRYPGITDSGPCGYRASVTIETR